MVDDTCRRGRLECWLSRPSPPVGADLRLRVRFGGGRCGIRVEGRGIDLGRLDVSNSGSAFGIDMPGSHNYMIHREGWRTSEMSAAKRVHGSHDHKKQRRPRTLQYRYA